MARSKARKQRRRSATPSPSQLRQRTVDALARGAFQKAREDARTLYKQEASAEHRRLLVEATIGRAAQLRQTGQLTEAIRMLRTVVEDVRDAPDLLGWCVREFIQAGEWNTAETLQGQIRDPAVLRQIEALRADAAVLQGPPGVASLPEDIRLVAQRVLHALADLEQGNDAAANETIADIPSDSCWHDWKVLIQGFTAFYAGEPAALQLWQQLDPERAPATMVAPFRAQLDPDFLANHPQQTTLLDMSQQFYAEPWFTPLEEAQRLLARNNLPTAMHRAVEAMKAMPTEQQELRHRLARTMYWQVVRLGDDDDIDDYAEDFGAPPDDPNLHRLRALAYERADLFSEAQNAWALYEQELTRHGLVSKEDRDLTRALVWYHMGELAEKAKPTLPAGISPPPGLGDADACARDAVDCFRQSAKLAPQYLQAHEALINLLHLAGKQKQVVRASKMLLKHFPEHQQALEALADDAFRRDRWDESVTLQSRAVQARPHDPELTAKLGFYELGLARQQAQHGQFDEARTILTTRLQETNTQDRCGVLCRLAAVELKAGEQQRGTALFEQACDAAVSRLAGVFRMLIESIRMPVDAKWIKQMDREFRRGLRAKVDGPSAVDMINTLAAFAKIEVSYEGMQDHQNLILQYLKRSSRVVFSEEEMKHICACLQVLPSGELLLDFATRGSKKFPRQPAFPFAVASYYFHLPPEECPLYDVDEALHTALDLAQDDPAYADQVQPIETLLSVVHNMMALERFSGRNGRFDDEGPFTPDIFDALANLFGMPFDDDDELDDFMRPRPRRSRGQRKRRSRRK